MGSSCSSGQAHKDKDSGSTRSEESPSYQVTHKVEPGSLNSGVVLQVSSEVKKQLPQEIRPPHCLPSVSDTASPSSPAPLSADKHGPNGGVENTPAATPVFDDLPSLVHRQTSKTAKIVVYICAADSQDCKVEKGVLHNEVYPQLRRLCRSRGYELHIVDLHWSLQEKTPEPAELCLHELRRQAERCYLVPVVLLNATLGAPLLPKTIESVDFETAASGVVAPTQGSNSPLLKWYRRDTHAQPPCYRLLPASYHIPAFKSENKEEKERAGEVWQSEVAQILSVMLATFTEELRDTYLSTVIEQEVQHTVLMSRELAKRCLWLTRVYTHAPQVGSGGPTNNSQQAIGGNAADLTATPDERNDRKTSATSGPAEAELNRRLALLQKALKAELNEPHIIRLQVKWSSSGLDPSGVPDHAHYVAQVASTAEKHLAAVIDSIIDEHNCKVSMRRAHGLPRWLLDEMAEQWRWAQVCAQCSVNRQSTLQKIREWDSDGPIVVYGAEGCGKTTLASRLVQTLSRTVPPSARVVFRTANLTRRSSTLAGMLLSVVLHCGILEVSSAKGDYRPRRNHPGPHTLANYAKILPEVMELAATKEENLIVIIDGIDQLREFSEVTVDWVPETLPKNVKLVLTLTEDSHLFNGVKNRLNSSKALFVKMTDLDKKEGESILLSSVVEYNHSVNSHVQDCVLASVQKCTLPLYIKVLAWQTSWCSEFEHSLQPRGDLREQLSAMLSDLETILGQQLVEMCLSLLTAAKWGLTDSEMIDLLTSNKDFHTSTTYLAWAGACLFWSVLNKQLWPFLRWHGGGSDQGGCGTSLTVTWRDWSLRRAVETRYEKKMAWAHSTLLAYFTDTLWDESSGIKARMIDQPNRVMKSYNRRKLEEVPYQCYKVKGSCQSYLTDHEWIYDKLCGSSVYEVLEDLRLEGTSGCPDLEWLESALERSARALDYDGSQFYAQMALRMSGLEGDTGSELPPLASKLESIIAQAPPVDSLVHSTPPDHGSAEAESAGDKLFDWLVRLPNNPNYVVTIRTDKEEISVWDAQKCERVRTLRGVPQPMSLQMIDDFRCVVLCRRELRTYDLDKGVLLTKLKGVMNQKMPYYGLHDASHLVALSRNRMYVNLMNLETGDLVTTFKAGEDRFLNSLLVSGDGRMLVCGDETQKPFPLLVWNLASRKLLYDLRIPGHDFITSLSAVTHQGHYVCCVAKELDEPSPNFIVVYDLQSGTLFKKWKPGVDCVAVDISSRDGCVVSGHADGSILVWDLITGNCRCKLRGHTAPVSFLRLDPDASACLSRDESGRDPSVRLWDLSTGEQSAVFTPDDTISNCELTGRGKMIVLASQGRSTISCLTLRGPSSDSVSKDDNATPAEDGRCYGDAENAGRVFVLEER